MDSLGRAFDDDDRSGGMFKDMKKINKQAFEFVHEETAQVKFVEEEKPKAPVSGSMTVVIIGSSYGTKFARDIVEAGEYSHYITSDAGEKQHVTKPLIQISDIPVVNYWLLAIAKCPRLSPLKEKVFIITNEDNHDEWTTWATNKQRSLGGFPVENLICNGSKDHHRPGTVSDLNLFIDKTGCKENILCIEADFVFEPEYNLGRIVEHSFVRGKDTMVGVPLKLNQDPATVAIIEGTKSGNPRVENLVMFDGSYPTKPSPLAAAPLYAIRHSSLPLLKEFAASGELEGAPYYKHMAMMFKYFASKVPVYALLSDYYFSVMNLEDTLFTDSFFEFYAKEKAKMFQSKKVSDTDSSLDWKTEYSGSQMDKVSEMTRDEAELDAEAIRGGNNLALDWRRGARGGPLAIATLMPGFEERYYAGLETRLQGDTDRRLPVRFTDASMMRHNPRKQHPVYTTSNNIYGLKQVSQQEMPMQWNGIKGTFSSQFNSHYRTTGFTTGRTTSRVHSEFDDF